MTKAPASSASNFPTKHKRDWRRAFVLLGVACGLVIAWGSDRQPVDVTIPITWNEPTEVHDNTEDVLRIASFNIHSGKGTDGQMELSRVATELADVDFAGLYEVRSTPPGHFPHQAAELGELLGMRSVFLATEHRWWRDHFGNALLTSRPILGLQRIPLIGTRGKAFRQAILVDVPFQDRAVHILMVHVDREDDREQQLAAVIRLFQDLEAPAVLMGDLNSPATDPQLSALLEHADMRDVMRVPREERAITDAIDWMIVKGLKPVSATYGSIGASDHPALKADLVLSERDDFQP